MSQAGSGNSDTNVNNDLYGSDLVKQLREGWSPLPSKTLFAMAIGGLKVRMMRSSITMLSIVLAIAFLAYTGLTSKVTYSIAQFVVSLEDFEPMAGSELRESSDALRSVDLVAELDQAKKIELAKLFEIHEVGDIENAIGELELQLRTATISSEKAVETLEAVRADEEAVITDIQEAEAKVKRTLGDVSELQVQLQEAKDQFAISQWIEGGGASDEQLAARLDELLIDELTVKADQFQRPARFDVEELPVAHRLLDSYYASRVSDEAMAKLKLTLEHEERKRQAAEIKGLLRSAGISLKATIEGNPMDAWLVTMALLTCAVGIANAMLMSVTERIREIGTMKCLGAQDSLVVKLFLLESSVLGMIGAGLGIVLGVLVAVVGAVLQFYTYGLTHFPLLDGLGVIALSVLSGMVLAVIGATYPAFSASRMRPVDALRVDE